MARKYHVAKQGSTSNYPERLEARGESSATVRMPFIDRRGRKYDSMEAMLRGERRRDQEDAEEKAERESRRYDQRKASAA